MTELDRRNGSGRGGYSNRKRRYRGRVLSSLYFLYELIEGTDDDEFDRRPQRRRYEEPLDVKVRKQLLSIAESVRLTMN